jgi:hypothetical protein
VEAGIIGRESLSAFFVCPVGKRNSVSLAISKSCLNVTSSSSPISARFRRASSLAASLYTMKCSLSYGRPSCGHRNPVTYHDPLSTIVDGSDGESLQAPSARRAAIQQLIGSRMLLPSAAIPSRNTSTACRWFSRLKVPDVCAHPASRNALVRSPMAMMTT